MTLLPDEAPDEEDFVACWLQPVMPAGTEHELSDGFPFAVIQYLTGADSVDGGTADGVVQVDFLDEARDGLSAAQAAKLSAREGHRRMLLMAATNSNVLLSDARWANCDYLDNTMKPTCMDYPNERVVRYTARYAIGLSFVPATD